MKKIISEKLDQIAKLCQSHAVEELYVIGSVLTDRFSAKSDIDFLVKFGKVDLLDFGDNYFDLQDKLEKLLDRRVDLVIQKDLHNEALIKELDSTKLKIYEASNSQMAA